MASDLIVTLNQENFEEKALKSSVPILVDFWAEWCGPCKQIAPLLDELATEYTGKVAIGKVDVDQNQGLAQKFNVSSIPTLLMIKDGQVVKQMVGFRSKRDLKAAFDSSL